jgi:dipeptidyl aminopeptidase/acylaminoacyl peptidase
MHVLNSKEECTLATLRRPIPIERYMEIRSAYDPSFSHDDQTLYFISTITGVPQVWVTEPGSPWPRQLTFFADRVLQVSPSPAGDRVVVSADEGGSENAQLFLTDHLGVDVEDLSGDPSHIYGFGAWAPDGQRFSFHSNRRNGRAFDVYIYDVPAKSFTAVHTSDYTNFAGRFSPDGTKLLITRQYTNLNNDIFLLDLASGELELLTPHESEAAYHPVGFAGDGHSLYIVTDANSEFRRLAQLDLLTKRIEFLTKDEWDTECAVLSSDGRYLAFAKNEDGTSRLYVWDIDSGTTADDAKRVSQLPAGVVSSLAWARHSHQLAITLSSPLYGLEVWTYHVEDNKLQRATYASVSAVSAETFVEPELVHYTSFDGLKIPAFYYVPKAVKGPYPVVVYVHGGPESQSRNSFNSVIQYFVQQGYAVFVPNVRGSSGYGRTYVHLDDVRKRMDSVKDLAACVDWLVEHGNAKRDAIAVMGGSYGGFMVLAAVTHHPHLWAAGVDIVGIANLRTFIENTSPYRRHLRECEYGTVEADGEFFDEISPIHHVDKITAPMIVIHGANDPRVPVSEAEQIVDALQRRNHPVEYLRFEDEGHGIVKLKNRIVAYGRIAEFLNKHLK